MSRQASPERPRDLADIRPYLDVIDRVVADVLTEEGFLPSEAS